MATASTNLKVNVFGYGDVTITGTVGISVEDTRETPDYANGGEWKYFVEIRDDKTWSTNLDSYRYHTVTLFTGSQSNPRPSGAITKSVNFKPKPVGVYWDSNSPIYAAYGYFYKKDKSSERLASIYWNDYIGRMPQYGEVIPPTVTVPSSISYASSINAYNSVKVSWGSSSGATSYVLERQLNKNGAWTQVYSGSGTSYTDYGLSSTTSYVQYRVKAVSGSSSSDYKTGSVASVYYSKPNTAPTMPSSISVPSTIQGGQAFTVSWGKSTDSDGNLSGYKLEQSYNGGSTWTQVYQGSATSTVVTIPFGAATQVMYRVRAYDSSGANSGYKVSGTSTVVNNNAPTIPPSITVPLTLTAGKTAMITWSAATDVDGNLAGYCLERSIDGANYSQIYQGENKSFSDTIEKDWNTVQYRVCAYDSYNSKGEYRVSEKRTVINNELPVITVEQEDLGLLERAFSFPYGVSDVESDTLEVVELLDNVEKRRFTAEKDSQHTFAMTAEEWICVLNGKHTITIQATDGDGGVGTKTVSFEKQEHEIVFTLKEPFATDAMAGAGIMNVVRSLPQGAVFTVEVCNNGYDADPSWQDVTKFIQEGKNFIVLNTEKTAETWGFSFRVTVKREQAEGELYISSVGGNFQ